ncbi:MAG: ABC-type transport auxiliary lipoprotein family protein [Gammaproteobacteria bacterium]
MTTRILLVGVLAAVIAGCGTLARPPAVNIIKLQLLGEDARIQTIEPVGASIAVAEPTALPGFLSARFAYLEEGLALRYYGKHEWTASPARLLQPALVRALDQSGGFDSVTAPPSIALADLRLDVQLTRLVHDFRQSEGGEIVLEVRAQLTSLQDRRVLATRSFEYREPAQAHPVAGAEAADRALARLLEDVVAFAAENANR